MVELTFAKTVDRVDHRGLLVRRHRPRRRPRAGVVAAALQVGRSVAAVVTKTGYATARNAWNAVSFTPVTTTALRIELTMQPGFSAGLQEWKVK